jgi:hypothetical protein
MFINISIFPKKNHKPHMGSKPTKTTFNFGLASKQSFCAHSACAKKEISPKNRRNHRQKKTKIDCLLQSSNQIPRWDYLVYKTRRRISLGHLSLCCESLHVSKFFTALAAITVATILSGCVNFFVIKYLLIVNILFQKLTNQ